MVDPPRLFLRLKQSLVSAAYEVSVKARHERAVAHAFFRFDGLPKAAGYSTDPRLGLSVKIEIDLRPPPGATLETTLLQRFYPVALLHHDLPSLFAGKLHALITRPYAKGRDWYDLVWYLTEHRGLQPNATLLGNALAQTGHDAVLRSGWANAVRRRLRSLEWEKVLRDLEPFIERSSDLAQLRKDHVAKLLKR